MAAVTYALVCALAPALKTPKIIGKSCRLVAFLQNTFSAFAFFIVQSYRLVLFLEKHNFYFWRFSVIASLAPQGVAIHKFCDSKIDTPSIS